MPVYVVDLIAEALNQRRRCLNGAHVFLLGVAYKRGVADTRESPALDVLDRLRQRGAEVEYADPHVPSVKFDSFTLDAVEVTPERLSAADCVVILTDHPEFDYRRVVELAPLVVDTRNATWGLPAPQGRVVCL
jgi:UDP-N-acetyl-D-glucosamine dehydrogenase